VNWRVGGAGAGDGEGGRAGDGAAELGKLPGRSEVSERSGEEGSSTRDELGIVGRLDVRGSMGIARELGGGLVFAANLPDLSRGCWLFLLMHEGQSVGTTSCKW
jgi:hypothetical protein